MNKLLQLICLILFFAQNNCYYQFIQEFFDETNVDYWDFLGWSTNYNDINDMKYDCAGDSIVGGYQKFDTSIFLQYDNLDTLYPHSKIKIEFQLFQLDAWNNNDQFHLIVDGNIVHTESKKDKGERDHVCGNQTQRPRWKDWVEVIEVEVNHVSDLVNIRFESDFVPDNREESWGINNVKIYVFVDCGPDAYLYDYGDENGSDYGCMPKILGDQCYNMLGNLDGDATLNDSVSSDCDFEVNSSDEHIYEIFIYYHEDYFHNPDCVTHRLYFHNTLLTQTIGTPQPNQWSYVDEPVSQRPITGTILAKIKHSDLITPYNCGFQDDILNSKFKWSCLVDLYLNFNNTDQFKYSFTMKSELGKSINAQNEVKILPNVITGYCCENTLEIETQLRICKSETCNDGYETIDPLTPFVIIRNTPLTIEHSIVTSEFANKYYLDVRTLTTGPFAPEWDDIIAYTSEIGRTIITFKPFVAMNGMTIEVTSRLDTVQSTKIGDRRRFLAEEEEDGVLTDDEAFVRDIEIISVIDEGSVISETQEIQEITKDNEDLIKEEEEKKKTYQYLMILCGALGIIISVGVVGVSFYVKQLLVKNKSRKEFMNSLQGKKMQQSDSSVSKAD